MSPDRPESPSGPASLDGLLGTLTEERRRRRTPLSSSADRAARIVREEVVEGRLRSGSRLPEERLAQALGVSRNTLREALSQLVGERILVREPNRGVVVATPEVDDVLDVYRVRRLIEPAAILEGEAHDQLRLDAVAAAVAEGLAARDRGDVDGVATANQHFHRAIVALAGSARLDAQMDLLLAEMRLMFHAMAARVEDSARFHLPFLEQNARIAEDLLAGRRQEAAAALASYLSLAQEQLVDGLSAPVETGGER